MNKEEVLIKFIKLLREIGLSKNDFPEFYIVQIVWKFDDLVTNIKEDLKINKGFDYYQIDNYFRSLVDKVYQDDSKID